MTINVSKLTEADLAGAVAIWNEIVEEGLAFPQEESLTLDSGRAFFAEQSFTGGAYDSGNGEMVGMYILHPNNVGRCGHICNASYAVKWTARGKHVGEALVRHCLRMGRNWAMVCSSSMLWSQPMNVLYAFIRNLVSPNSVLFQRDSVTKTVITKTLFHIITNCKGAGPVMPAKEYLKRSGNMILQEVVVPFFRKTLFSMLAGAAMVLPVAQAYEVAAHEVPVPERSVLHCSRVLQRDCH